MNELESIEINLSVQNRMTKTGISPKEGGRKIENSQKSDKSQSIDLISDDFSFSKSEGKVSTQDMENLMEKVQQYVDSFNTKLAFSVDKESNRPIIYVIDKETNEVIREIPPRKMFKLIKNLEEIRGLIFQGKV